MTAFVNACRMSACIEELHLLTGRLRAFADANGLGNEQDWEGRGEPAVQYVRGARTLVLLLAPFCPHLAEELWERLGEPGLVCTAAWPG
jgi:leucyl-tRNA synthetase